MVNRMGPGTIKIFTTGGSIDKGYSTIASDFIVMDPGISNILQQANLDLSYSVESLIKKDSLEITPADREMIAARVAAEQSARILITHGTDTMYLTGQALSAIPEKTIVITGAMQPAAFKESDAHFNIGFALAALQLLPAGVYIAMNGQIFDPFKVKKDVAANRFYKTP